MSYNKIDLAKVVLMKQEKVWYLLINDIEEGPYSFGQLRSDNRITPETLARKFDWKAYRPIGKIPELKRLFEDPIDLKELSDLQKPSGYPSNDEIVALQYNRQNPIFLLLLMIIALLIFLIFLQIDK